MDARGVFDDLDNGERYQLKSNIKSWGPILKEPIAPINVVTAILSATPQPTALSFLPCNN